MNDGNMNGRKQKKEDSVCIVISHQLILVTFIVYIRKEYQLEQSGISDCFFYCKTGGILWERKVITWNICSKNKVKE